MDVDCSSITYDTKPSPVIMTAVEKAKKEMEQNMLGEVIPLGRTESANESLANSLLTQVDTKTASDDDLREAFCRDIDSFSFEMQVLNCNDRNTNIPTMHHSPVKLIH